MVQQSYFGRIVPNLIDHPHLIVFGRYPRVGTTKTRLIPACGAAGAAALQKRLTEITMATAHRTVQRAGARLVFCHDGEDEAKVRRWLGSRKIDRLPQAAGDLGQRMFKAIQAASDRGARRVVLVGTDIPGLTAASLLTAFDALISHDLVLGPSIDGGYWLVGMTRPVNIFDGIVWGTPQVLEKTLALARRNGMQPYLLDPLSDLDTPGDLMREMGCRYASRPYLSVIVPTLNEEGEIARTLARATSPDAEIIVADGGSTDRTLQIARSLGARIVDSKRGRAVQQNRGAGLARGEVLLFLHADTRLPDHYVAHIFDTLMDPRTMLGAFRFQTDIASPFMRRIVRCTNLRARWLKLPYGDQGLFMRRVDFLKVGGFPETPIAEDLLLVRRMAGQGRVVLAPAAALTSGRRWQRLGPMRTTIINAIIAVGCLAGIKPHRLTRLYRSPASRGR